MKRLSVLVVGLGVAALLSIGAAWGMGMGCGMGSGMNDQGAGEMGSMPGMESSRTMTDTTSAMGCPLMIQGTTMTVKDIPNGVQIVLTGTTRGTIENVREKARHVLAMRGSMTDSGAAGNRANSPSQTTIYTCPMHPEVVRNAPGQCPKCGMNLEPKATD